jgi:hypothetical protein
MVLASQTQEIVRCGEIVLGLFALGGAIDTVRYLARLSRKAKKEKQEDELVYTKQTGERTEATKL